MNLLSKKLLIFCRSTNWACISHYMWTGCCCCCCCCIRHHYWYRLEPVKQSLITGFKDVMIQQSCWWLLIINKLSEDISQHLDDSLMQLMNHCCTSVMHSLQNLRGCFCGKLALSPLSHTEIGTGIIDLFWSLLSGVFLPGCLNILKEGVRAGRLNGLGSISTKQKMQRWGRKRLKGKKGKRRMQQIWILSLCVWEKWRAKIKAEKNGLGSVVSPLLSRCLRARHSIQKQRIHAHQTSFDEVENKKQKTETSREKSSCMRKKKEEHKERQCSSGKHNMLLGWSPVCGRFCWPTYCLQV